MLCSAKDLKNWEVAARDGDIGKVREIYFDDRRWTVRYLVVDTGGWLSGRRVLLLPHVVERFDAERQRLVVTLDRKEVEDAPGIDTDRPVSRQQELAQYDYYGLPYYWSGTGLWGAAAYPPAFGGFGTAQPPLSAQDAGADPGSDRLQEDDAHLRSSKAVTGYRIAARDGEIGHLEDLLFDDRSWEIRHAVVETRNWLPGPQVLLAPADIEQIDWAERHLRVRLTREQVKAARAREDAH